MRINVVYSTQHWIFPIITIGILVILGVLLIVLEGRARVKAGKGFFAKPGAFFEKNYDKVKFWGTLVLLVVYFFFLDKIGFTIWSIICLFLFNTLFANKEQMKNPKYHVTSIIISVVAVSYTHQEGSRWRSLRCFSPGRRWWSPQDGSPGNWVWRSS